MAERGVTVTYETIRAWCYKFGQDYAKRIRVQRGQLGDTWHLDEVYLKIGGCLQYLWRAVETGWQCPRHPGATPSKQEGCRSIL